MRYLLVILVIASFVANGQNATLRLGAGAAIFQDYHLTYGGEVVGSIKVKNRVSAGAGVNVLHMENTGLFVPAFVTVGYQVNRFTFHIDPGYNAYASNSEVGSIKFNTKGGFYIGSGVIFTPLKKLYVNLQYSLYSFRTTGTNGTLKLPESTNNIHAGFLSVGYYLSEK